MSAADDPGTEPPQGPTLWVDADACPRPVKDILFRAADRTGIALILVANQPISVPRRRNIRALCVAPGLDAADQEIVRRCRPGDLVVTADIPLAAEVVERGATAVNPRGVLYTRENVRQQLSLRDFMSDLRGAGIDTGGPSGFGERDRQAFARQLDRWLARLPKV
ncbi:YaiI/YqxD family protein [Pseudomarimonas salicorniae]|uniref:UPF0178 protein M0G41_14445 n=1 Tax=Pseudomarimonas salicorniae TaxID=2933270 RepID=A0ABT0GJZ5_9GAMM|nr:YaiI/YqxD family protein [Lysobacter sp. CAU 1642]MCK7594866.1 YaiI/YqxD family protein [Lysobacter sp. CAU 1642]